jgi:hypothetical protein
MVSAATKETVRQKKNFLLVQFSTSIIFGFIFSVLSAYLVHQDQIGAAIYLLAALAAICVLAADRWLRYWNARKEEQ